MQKICIDNKDIFQDAINIAHGVYYPLSGFLKRNDFQTVLDKMRLENGLVWSIPIVIDVDQTIYEKIKDETKVVVTNPEDKSFFILDNIEVFQYNKYEFVEKIYLTHDNKHPGVSEIMQMNNYLLGGDVVYKNEDKVKFADYNYTPAEMRQKFESMGWERIVAFQTRNVPHCGHEFLQKKALEKVDGLLIHPVIGEKKMEDFKDEYILSSYQILIDKYFPKDKVILGILPIKMRYAGPREAIMHALIRKNYGCTHFIVGRDHAGVGKFYSPTAAQEIFDQFNHEELGIEIMKFPEVVYDGNNKKHCFIDDCPPQNRLGFSGTSLRDSIKKKERPPEYLIRPEVYNLLVNSNNSLVDRMYKENKNNTGFVLWFTGYSASGKSTIADRVYDELIKRKIKIERLDGDVVREGLTKDLGFSRNDRDENIRRIGFVAQLLSRNGVGVIASFISPYRNIRDELRKGTNNFVEVFVDTPLEVCEQRDKKGLYQKARRGEIENFTGISDPYETPENPEIHLRDQKMELEEKVSRVISYLEENNMI